jgi:hypothetical protein
MFESLSKVIRTLFRDIWKRDSLDKVVRKQTLDSLTPRLLESF